MSFNTSHNTPPIRYIRDGSISGVFDRRKGRNKSIIKWSDTAKANAHRTVLTSVEERGLHTDMPPVGQIRRGTTAACGGSVLGFMKRLTVCNLH